VSVGIVVVRMEDWTLVGVVVPLFVLQVEHASVRFSQAQTRSG
jgi:hypothetical protein